MQANKCVFIIFFLNVSSFQFLLCHRSFGVNQIVADENLIFVHTLCRHGDRNADPTYPNDPWNSDKYWPGGLSALTNKGKQQEYENGLYFRKRYSRLIGNGKYSPDKVYVRSSDFERTLMSAAAALAGLFPPTGTEIWNKYLNWQPIPIHTSQKDEDNILAELRLECDRYTYLMNKYYLSKPEYTEMFTKNKEILKQLEIQTGKSLSTVGGFIQLTGGLQIEEQRKYRLPPWAKDLLMDKSPENMVAQEITSHFYTQWTLTPGMKRLASGYLLKEILDRFTNKTRSTLSPDRSLWMYFAHDTTISPMLHALNLNSDKAPPLAACLLFELYQSDDEPYIQIFYKNSTETNLPAMEIPNCGTKCPLYRMYELYDDVLPKQSYEDECQLRDGETYPTDGNPELDVWKHFQNFA